VAEHAATTAGRKRRQGSVDASIDVRVTLKGTGVCVDLIHLFIQRPHLENIDDRALAITGMGS
jgi:hypothetical protein